MATSITPAREDSPEAGELVATRRGRYHVLTRFDRRVLMLMVGIPLLLDVLLVQGPCVGSNLDPACLDRPFYTGDVDGADVGSQVRQHL